ncbi:unnamed protein product [Pieris macdunnoughi]|uniref:Uncharacterized protein n=1 Tax=Pieris macdunnoughi TaxID=345717 RepID=A0A821PNX6_9NEOP|nr:unnamed protein product [Pieris macdunnoughi]
MWGYPLWVLPPESVLCNLKNDFLWDLPVGPTGLCQLNSSCFVKRSSGKNELFLRLVEVRLLQELDLGLGRRQSPGRTEAPSEIQERSKGPRLHVEGGLLL